MNELTIVIPTLNEEEAIGKVIDELRALGYNNILVVDGHSKDRTVEIVRKRGVKVILQSKRGKANAIKDVIKEVSTKYILIMDGDYTYDPRGIKDMLKLIKEHDEVIGYRYNRENIPLLNRIGNWILTKTFNILFGTSLNDVCSGMYILRTRGLREFRLESKGFSIEAEIAAQVVSSGGSINEVKINYRKRVGDKKLKLFHGLLIFRDIIVLALKYNPAFLIFGLASLVSIPSVIAVGWVAYEYFLFRVKHYIWAIISVAGSGIGLVSFILAILSLYLKRLEYRILRKLESIRKGS